MSSIDLFLLGFLNKKSISAYNLAKFVEENHLNQMIKISTPAIYKNLINLKEKGYLVSKSIKSGNMSEKMVYDITEKGKKYFRLLMEEQSQKDFSIYFDFNSFIINLDQMNKKEAEELLNNFKKVLVQKKILYSDYKNKFKDVPFAGKSIIKQLNDVNNLIIEWLDEQKREHNNK
ncbi:PadR family transcriptional regulator [Patescibacteria group bacterium]|nr:PadR family transcriptional regulator [Patescibacteria group bacterium]